MAEPPKDAPPSEPEPEAPKSAQKPRAKARGGAAGASGGFSGGGKRLKRFASLGDCAAPLMRPVFEKRGFAEARIAADWTTIVGVRLARLCRPIKILRQGPRGSQEGGLLVIGARSGAAMELTHAAPQIVERVNVFYGRRVVDRLKVDQTLAPSARPPASAPPPESPPPLAEPLAALDAIDDPGLRAALERLARNRVSFSNSPSTSRKVP
ncbi:DUF721 domain-containing protein [Neomegalonema perideroedes]|uniref:DUF721 domain-containing protein n=1 Tax=Neomegalonema perideroedes TaxID=217219 RepID=UPI00036D0DF9|nr:DUF721 domain-containing protein [Neomegalonema perideroedes]